MSQDTKAPREQLEGLLTGALRIILDVRKALRAVRMRGVGGPGGWFVYVKAPGRMEIDYWDTEPFEAVEFYARSAAALAPDEDKHAAKEAIIAQAEVRASLESLDDARAAEVLREFDKLRPRVPPDLLKAVAEVCEKHPMDYGSEPLFPGVTYQGEPGGPARSGARGAQQGSGEAVKGTNYVTVQGIDSDKLVFSDGSYLQSQHEQDCCESHYLEWPREAIGIVVDTEGEVFERVDGYGIRLLQRDGLPVPVPGYGYNNGYYSNDLRLVLVSQGKTLREWDVSECQRVED